MPRHHVHQRYQSYRDGVQYGPWPAGQVVDLDDEQAAWVNRDSPGTLSPEHAEPAKADHSGPDDGEETKPRKATPRNRQHRPGRNRAAGTEDNG